MHCLRKINTTLVLFLLFLCCTQCKLSNESNTKNTIYFSDGRIKSAVEFKGSIKDGKALYYYHSGDTHKYGEYSNDSVVFMLTYDSLGNKTEDERMLFYEFDKPEYYAGDSVIVTFWINGPDTTNIFLYASARKIFPDTTIRFYTNLKQDISKSKDKFVILSQMPGKYQLHLNCMDTKIMKVIGHKKVYVTLK